MRYAAFPQSGHFRPILSVVDVAIPARRTDPPGLVRRVPNGHHARPGEAGRSAADRHHLPGIGHLRQLGIGPLRPLQSRGATSTALVYFWVLTYISLYIWNCSFFS